MCLHHQACLPGEKEQLSDARRDCLSMRSNVEPPGWHAAGKGRQPIDAIRACWRETQRRWHQRTPCFPGLCWRNGRLGRSGDAREQECSQPPLPRQAVGKRRIQIECRLAVAADGIIEWREALREAIHVMRQKLAGVVQAERMPFAAELPRKKDIVAKTFEAGVVQAREGRAGLARSGGSGQGHCGLPVRDDSAMDQVAIMAPEPLMQDVAKRRCHVPGWNEVDVPERRQRNAPGRRNQVEARAIAGSEVR